MLSSIFLLFGMKLKDKYENFVKNSKEYNKINGKIKKWRKEVVNDFDNKKFVDFRPIYVYDDNGVSKEYVSNITYSKPLKTENVLLFVKEGKENGKEEVLTKEDVEKFKSTGNIFLIVSFILAFFAISFGFFIDNSLTPLRVTFLYMCVVFLGCLISMRNAGKLKD